MLHLQVESRTGPRILVKGGQGTGFQSREDRAEVSSEGSQERARQGGQSSFKRLGKGD